MGEVLDKAYELRQSQGEWAWLADFVQRPDMGQTGNQLRKTLIELIVFCHCRPAPNPDFDGITAGDLADIAATLRDRIAHVIAADDVVWIVHLPERIRRLSVFKDRQGDLKVADQTLSNLIGKLKTSAEIVAQAVIGDDPHRIRLCAREGCGRWFARVKRQEFCSERCSNYQRKRLRRANRKLRDRDNKKRREAYERNVKS